MKRVVADTGPLYALVDPDDAHHARAQGEAKRLREEGVAVLVGYPTVCEGHTLVLRRLGARAARSWLDDIRQGCGLLNPVRAYYQAAAKRVAAFSDQPITLFDALVAELAEQLELPVWTYDHDFDVMGVKVWR